MFQVKLLPTEWADAQSARDQDQLARKEVARQAWRDGHSADGLLILRSVLAEDMSPAVAAECYSTEAGMLAEMGDFVGSLQSLRNMAPFLEAASPRIQGTFYNQRGRVNRKLSDIGAALMDYTGALAIWQECGDKHYEGAASINLAELYLKRDDLEQASANIDHALRVLPDGSEYWPDACDTKAKILLAEGSPARALLFIDKALDLIGENEAKFLEFLETRNQIKSRMIDLLAPLMDSNDVERLRVRMISHALDKSGGSITAAAKLISTSHQVIAHAARKYGLERSSLRKKSIIKNLS